MIEKLKSHNNISITKFDLAHRLIKFGLAHHLVKFGLSISNYQDWVEDHPDIIKGVLF